MGLKTSGLSFMNVMEQLLMKCKYRNAVAYVDDVAIYSPTWERHLQDLDEVLKLFIKGNIKLKSEKCEFGTTKMEFLGFKKLDVWFLADKIGVKKMWEKNKAP